MHRFDPKKPSSLPSDQALFRFSVVSQVLSRVLRGELCAQAIADVADQHHVTHDGRARKVSARTLYRWLAAYGERDIGELEPASRQRTTSSVVLSQRLLDFVRTQKDVDIAASLPEILRRAREVGILTEHESVDRSTLYRACVRMGVPVVRRKKAKVRDAHRFIYPHRMDMNLCDGKHFRAGVRRAKRVVLFYLDDASRLGLSAVVGPSESTALFLRGLYESIQHHGVAGIYYQDHGPGFISKDTQTVIAQLPAVLIHGEVAYPEGHGAIERFNQTALQAVLRNLAGRPDVDADCGPLELRLRHWMRETYNHTPHEGLPRTATGQFMTPWQRFSQDSKPLRLPESLAALQQRFVIELQRRVSNDHIVQVDGVDYETPRGLAGTKVRVWRHVLDGTVRVLHPDGSGRLVQLQPVDLGANAKDRRADAPAGQETHAIPAMSAADRAYARDFRPVVGVDGGFSDPDDQEK